MDWLRAVSPSPAVTARAARGSARPSSPPRRSPGCFSPYQFNPANFHPLRGIVEEMLDFDAVCSAQGPEALHQRHQRARRQAADLPGRRDHRRRDPRLGLPADALPGDRDRRPAAPAGARPTGTAATPATRRSIRCSTAPRTPDIVIVHINPLYREELPQTAVGNRQPDQRDQLQRFAAARAAQHRLRQPADRPRHRSPRAR